MHLHCERSYGCPNHYADNRQLNFHCLRKQHHPAKFYHFRHQIEQTLEHLQRQETRVDDKRLVRHLYPSSHHKQFPRCYYDTLQLFLPSFQILQPVSDLKSTKKWVRKMYLFYFLFIPERLQTLFTRRVKDHKPV